MEEEIEYLKAFPKYARDRRGVYKLLMPVKGSDSGAWYAEMVKPEHTDYEKNKVGAQIDPQKWIKPGDDLTPITAKAYYEVRQKAIDQMQAGQPPKEKPFNREEFVKDTYDDGMVERAIPSKEDCPPPPLTLAEKIYKIYKELTK